MCLISFNLPNGCWDTKPHYGWDPQPPHCQDPQVTYPEGGSSNPKYMPKEIPLEIPLSSTCRYTPAGVGMGDWSRGEGCWQCSGIPVTPLPWRRVSSKRHAREEGALGWLSLPGHGNGVFTGYVYRIYIYIYIYSDPPCRSEQKFVDSIWLPYVPSRQH